MLSWFRPNQSLILLLNSLSIDLLIEEETNTNFIAFGLTQAGLEHTIYHTRGEHTTYVTECINYRL
jgi:hypothetical protein